MVAPFFLGEFFMISLKKVEQLIGIEGLEMMSDTGKSWIDNYRQLWWYAYSGSNRSVVLPLGAPATEESVAEAVLDNEQQVEMKL